MSLNIADIYGGPSQAANPTGSAVQSTGPNQASVANTGQTGGMAGAPAMSWVSIAIVLVVLRIIIDMANK